MAKGIGIVKYGELNFYYPLQFIFEKERKLNFQEVTDCIANSSYAYNENYNREIDRVIRKGINELSEEMMKKTGMYLNIKKSMYEDNENKILCCEELKEIFAQRIEVNIFDIKNIEVKSEIFDKLNKAGEMHEVKTFMKEKFYGKLYSNSQTQIPLLPVLINIFNNQEEIVIPELILFNNMFGIIRITIPVVGEDIKSFMDGYSEVFNEGKILHLEQCINVSTIADIARQFAIRIGLELNTTFKNKIGKTMFDGYSFVHFIILDSDAVVIDKKLNKEIEQEIFFVLQAPVPNRNQMNYNKEIMTFCNEQFIDNKVCKTFVKTNGGCLSLFNDQIKNRVLDECKDGGDNEFEFARAASELEVNFEFAIIFNIFEKLNKEMYLSDKAEILSSRKSRLKEKYASESMIKYNENKIYFNQMLQQAYGSVIDQVYEFKKKMPLYHLQVSYEEQINSINEVIEYKRASDERQFNKMISVLGYIFIVIFGLPTIHEMIKIITGAYLNEISIGIWSGLILVSLLILFMNKDNNKF